MKRKEYKLPNGKKGVFEYDVYGIGNVTLECMDELMGMIADRPQWEWIPCSERLPEKPYGCLVTVESSRFDGGEFVECESILPYFVGYDENDWYDDDGEQCQYEVIAWMPLPEPYKEENEK